jgi:gamma-glutamyltranspeptidase/glutathione hydrolase
MIHTFAVPLVGCPSLVGVFAVLLAIATSARADTVVADNFAAATVNPHASQAALDVYCEGGNAVDAAIAAALTLSVVDGHNSGIGGGCLILVRTSQGELIAIDGRETAPAAASPQMFVENGRANPQLSQTGPLAVGVPGALAAYQLALEKCGTKPLSRLLEPGRALAESGFAIDRPLASAIASHDDEIKQFEATRRLLLDDQGRPWPAGHVLKQADLSRTYRSLQEQGIDWFYRGPFAAKVGDWMQQNGGLLAAEDFASYRAIVRQPLQTSYRNHTIVGFPPPSSGGVHIAQMLNMLEQFDVKALHADDPAKAMHVIAEVFSRAFADRAYWLGDADFAPVPRGLIDKAYAAKLAASIDLEKATPVAGHGQPPRWRQDLFQRHTTHIAAADAAGNWVAITATVNTSFGSKVIVPGTGVVLNNEMDDFSIEPGVANAFGLVGAEANAVAPGKRPLSSMSPTIVLDAAGQPRLAVGAAGGPKIITQVLLALVRVLDLGEPLDQAIASPRWHHQWRPNRLGLEKSVPAAQKDYLQSLGHTVYKLPTAGVTQGIERLPSGKLAGTSDPRVPGKTVGK